MCATCGCGSDATSSVRNLEDHHAHEHHHDHGHEHSHSHSHQSQGHSQNGGHSHQRIIDIERNILHENDLLAQRNRGYFDAKNILALNLVSSPGSGKTTLLEKTLTDLKNELKFYVIEGDQQTSNDADRIHATGTKVTQINTGKGCHLDAHMILHALQGMKPEENSVMFIENVGNLVCPAMFDLGESERVVVMSVTEGEDKPLKYPDMFHTSTVCVINKIDLLPYVPFDLEKAKEYALKVNPKLEIIEVSCTSGEGLDKWYSWLKSKIPVVV